MSINKNAIIITGGNSGIGFECVKQFCEEHINATGNSNIT